MDYSPLPHPPLFYVLGTQVMTGNGWAGLNLFSGVCHFANYLA
jgi:hypothetical protein